MTTNNIHGQLSIALRLFNKSLKKWASERKRPDGTIGVHPSLVIRCAQGKEDSDWLRDDIENLIKEAQNTFPDYYEFHNLSMAW